MLLKKGPSKDNNTSSNQDLYPKNTIAIAGDSIIMEFLKTGYVEKNMW